MKKILSIFTLLLFTGLMQAQRNCYSEQYQNQLNQSLKYQLSKSIKQAEKQYKTVQVRDSLGDCNEVVTIPVAIHFFGLDSSSYECAKLSAIDQIRTLNEDFKGKNKDLKNFEKWKKYFPEIKIKAPCFKFEIPEKGHPINSGLTDGEKAIIFYDGLLENYNAIWNNYLNIYVGKIGVGILGYSPLGGWANGDGVVIDKKYFSSLDCGEIGGDDTFNKGRTLTHEIGHYLLLDHIWGIGCSKDDGVTDTPNSASPYNGCPPLFKSCGSTDLHMNYMDYVDDSCMYMFTSGQIDWMDEYLFSDLDNLIQKGREIFNIKPVADTLQVFEPITLIDSNNLTDTPIVEIPYIYTDTLETATAEIPTLTESSPNMWWLLMLPIGVLILILIMSKKLK